LGQSKFKTLIVEEKQNVLRIILNRPDKMNALNAEMYAELHSVLDMVEHNPECRVLIFTGSGKAFCAGGDISELLQAAATLESAQSRLRKSHHLAMRMRGLKQPVIMAVNGAAIGAGFSLALNGDLIIASETARFGASFLRVGLTPDMGSIHNLVHLLGTSKACELSFMADIIDARQAEKMGVVNRVVESEKLDELADEWAQKMAKLPFLPMSLLKKAIYKAQDMNFLAEIEDEINLQSLCLLSKEGKEGLKAFLEKRTPNFNT
jgi:2-(1,2-epoxy-1,2-dihydrophenyl)acetyl-CoA isomerase